VAEKGIRVVIWGQYPSFWYASSQEYGVDWPTFTLITSGILFSGLQNGTGVNFFEILPLEAVSELSLADILNLRGPPPLG
jgi:hypothetical protein